MRPGSEVVVNVVPTAGQSNQIYNVTPKTVFTGFHARLTGTYTEGASAQQILAWAPLGFLRRLELNLGGGSPLLSADGRLHYFWNAYTRGGGTQGVLIPPLGGANQVTNIEANIWLDIMRYDLHPPYNTSFFLNARALATLMFIADYGGTADIDAAASGGTFSNMNLTITAEEWQDVTGEGSYSQLTKRQFVPIATGDMSPGIDLQCGGPIYRGVVLHAVSGAADPNQTPLIGDDTVISAVSLITDNGVRIMDHVPWATVQARNRTISSWQGAWPPGFAVLDWAYDHSIRHELVTVNRNSLTVVPTIGALPANAQILVYTINDLLVQRKPQGTAKGRRR